MSYQELSTMLFFNYDVPTDITLEGYYYIYHGYSTVDRNVWRESDDKKHALRVFEDYESLDPYGEKISVRPASLRALNINTFTTNLSNEENVEVIDDILGGEDIRLQLNDKIVNLIFDQSGSAGWNDPDNVRHDLAERIIKKINATYPGNLQYSIFKFGGEFFNLVFGAATVSQFEALDDLEARLKERDMIKDLSYENAEIKLQEVFPDKAPRGIGL